MRVAGHHTDGAITTSTADCPDGRDVVLITVDGGGHEWPSFATQALWQSSRRTRPPHAAIAVTTIVQLFRKTVTLRHAIHACRHQSVPQLRNYNPATSPVLTEALIREGASGASTR